MKQNEIYLLSVLTKTGFEDTNQLRTKDMLPVWQILDAPHPPPPPTTATPTYQVQVSSFSWRLQDNLVK